MTKIERRSALTGIGAASTFLLSGATTAVAQTGGPQATALGQGVRQIVYGEGPSIIPGATAVKLRDIVLEPGAKIDPNPMKPMICHMAQGELEVTRTNESFTAKQYRIWTCNSGMSEGVANRGTTVAVMRIIDLVA